MSTNPPVRRQPTWVLVSIVGVVSFACGVLFGPALSISTEVTRPSAPPAPTSTISPTFAPTKTAANTATPTATALPPIYVTLNVNQYATYTIYWKRALWENATGGSVTTEDFESDKADFGVLSFPYLTGNGILLRGHISTGQILNDESLMPSGNLLHFDGWEGGLTFSFPYDTAVSAFGFDYQSPEAWLMAFDGTKITLLLGRKGFVGVVFARDYPREFLLSSEENVQHGLAMDNISFLTVNSP
jgi:hypothetical protein